MSKKNKKESQTGVYLKDDRVAGTIRIVNADTCGNCGHWKSGFCKRNAPAPVLTTKFDEALYIARWAKVEACEVACGEFKGTA